MNVRCVHTQAHLCKGLGGSKQLKCVMGCLCACVCELMFVCERSPKGWIKVRGYGYGELKAGKTCERGLQEE